MGKRLVITEKPSVARDIAAALGGFSEEDEYLEGEDYVVTWAVGHLLELADPKEYDKKWRSWSIKLLPILPEAFEIRPKDGHKKRLAQIKKLGKRKDVEGLINACDAGREGELIYRRIVEFTGLGSKPQQRLWLQSMTPDAIRTAFDDLRPGDQLDNLADAAWLRSVGDWLIGMNATRALTQRLKSGGERSAWSAGRVQTPTLNLLVVREREILAHKPRPYWEIVVDATHHTGDGHVWQGRLHDAEAAKASDDPDAKASRLFDKAQVDRLHAALATVTEGRASEKRKKSKQKPPLPFDLTSLQREANRRFSMSAKRTLNATQRLYEGHKLVTYPRTDSRHLPDDYGTVVPKLLEALAELPKGDWSEHAGLAEAITTAGPLNLDKVLDSSKVSDHFAIVPTGNPLTEPLGGDDLRIFDLIVRQFLAALMGPATWASVERFVDVEVGDVLAGRPARFRTTARSLEIPGFLEALGQEAGSGTTLPSLIAGQDQAEGITVRCSDFAVEDKETKPPGRYTEAQLLRMMETAGEKLDEDELSDAMKDRGLGTPATRADTIEGLVRKTYAHRVGGKLTPTAKAMRLIDVLERVDVAALASPKLTGEWEFALYEVANGTRTRSDVETAFVEYTKTITSSLTGFEYSDLYKDESPVGTCPACGHKVLEEVRGYLCERNTGVGTECDFIIWKERMGRYIDRQLSMDLLAAEDHLVGPVPYFVDMSGRRFLQGTVQLAKNYVESKDTEMWGLVVNLGGNPSEEDTDPETVLLDNACPCPAEHEGITDCVIVETNHRWVCKRILEGHERKGPVLPKKVCHRDILPEEAIAFFGEAARTDFLEDFISRRGRPFRGALIRKPTGKHGFEFPPREPRATKAKAKPKAKAGAKKKRAPRKKAAPATAAAATTPAPKKKRAPRKRAPAASTAAAATTEATAAAATPAPKKKRAPRKRAPAASTAATTAAATAEATATPAPKKKRAPRKKAAPATPAPPPEAAPAADATPTPAPRTRAKKGTTGRRSS